MGLADKAGDWKLNQHIQVRMEAKNPAEGIDEPDDLMAIGEGLVVEAMKVLQMAAEAEGFKVTIHLGQVAC